MPVSTLVAEIVSATVKELGLERDDSIVEELASRWARGMLVLRPSDPSLQSKEVPVEAFFHKIVMTRNNFRVLEEKDQQQPAVKRRRESRTATIYLALLRFHDDVQPPFQKRRRPF